jgi:hypothetical protein
MKVSFVSLVVLIFLFFIIDRPTAAEETGLLIPIAAPLTAERDTPCRSTIPLAPADNSTMTQSYVTLNAQRLAALRETETLDLNLANDLRYTAVRREVLLRPSGESGYVWTGTLADIPDSSVILVVGDNQLYGRIGFAGRYITLRQVDGEVYTIEQHVLDAVPVTLVDVESGASAVLPLTLPADIQRLEDGSQINMMVVYTPAAQSILERVAGSVSLAIDGAIVHTNTIFENSGIFTRLNLVHVAPVFYLEQPNEDFSADLNHLMGKSDSYMDEVHTLRDHYAADLVAMISGVWFASYAGIAPDPAPLNEAKGFSITEACNIQDTTFTEQIGFNLGSARDFVNANSTAEFPVLGYGHGYQATDASFVTVMALRTGGACPPVVTENVCSKIERFSSPHQTYEGQPLGNETTANNVRSINELAATVANYRTINPDAIGPLVINGGFEIDADRDKTPDFWKIGSEGKAKVDCVDAGHNSLCALKLSGAGSRTTQILDGEVIPSGAPLLVSFWVRRNKLVVGGEVRLILRDANGAKSLVAITIPPGTNVYQQLSVEGIAPQTVKKAKLIARLKGSEIGKLWLDDISVTIFESEAVRIAR